MLINKAAGIIIATVVPSVYLMASESGESSEENIEVPDRRQGAGSRRCFRYREDRREPCYKDEDNQKEKQ